MHIFLFLADACLKAILTILPNLEDASAKSELFLESYIKKLLSTLLVVPDNPDRGVVGLLKSLLNVIRQLEWNKLNCNLAILYISVLDLLSSLAKEEYPYHVDKGLYKNVSKLNYVWKGGSSNELR